MIRTSISIMFYWTGFFVWVIITLTASFCLTAILVRLLSEWIYAHDKKISNKQ
jgi:hypothetical protein